MTLTMRDKIIMLVFAFVLCAYGAYRFLWVPAGEKIVQLEEKKLSVEGLAGDISPLIEKSDKLRQEEKKLKESVENIKSFSGGLTTTNEEFLVFLGNSTKENNVVVTGFNDLGMTNDGGIYKAVFDFELKGSSTDINKVLEDIVNIGIKCSFGSVSYRQNEQYDYLKRFFDDLSDLPWYKEPENDENQEPELIIPDIDISDFLPDFDIPDWSDIPDVVPEEPKQQEPAQEMPQEPEIPDNNEPKSIEDRLNDLLENTYSANKPYRVMFLANNQGSGVSYKEGQDMRLSVTVCFIMYNEPSMSTSFLSQAGGEDDGIF